MLDPGSKPNTRDRFGGLLWVALSVYFAGLLFVFVTENAKIWILFSLAAGAIACVDYYVRKATLPRSTVPLLDPRDSRKRFQYSPLIWAGFALALLALICISHIRISALLLMTALCVLVLSRYQTTRPASVRKSPSHK